MNSTKTQTDDEKTGKKELAGTISHGKSNSAVL